MDRRTAADKALLEGYLRRHQGPVAFLDESYRKHKGPEVPGFYILAATIFQSYEIASARQRLLQASGLTHWHTTDQYHLGNHQEIQRVGGEIGNWSSQLLVVFDEFGEESNLEFSRRKCMYQLIKLLEARECSMIIYERRNTRFQVNSDNALTAKLASLGHISRSTRIFGSSPAAETLLWAPDLVAWSIRRLVTSDELQWLQALGQTVEISFISETTKTLIKEKRPGPASAYPGPGLSVDHKGEGMGRSSVNMFPHTPAFGQAVTQLLVTTKEPIVEPALAGLRLSAIFNQDRK
jgi:hypothetical protein